MNDSSSDTAKSMIECKPKLNLFNMIIFVVLTINICLSCSVAMKSLVFCLFKRNTLGSQYNGVSSIVTKSGALVWHEFGILLNRTAHGLDLVFKKHFDQFCLFFDRVLEGLDLLCHVFALGSSRSTLVLIVPGPAVRKEGLELCVSSVSKHKICLCWVC